MYFCVLEYFEDIFQGNVSLTMCVCGDYAVTMCGGYYAVTMCGGNYAVTMCGGDYAVTMCGGDYML